MGSGPVCTFGVTGQPAPITSTASARRRHRKRRRLRHDSVTGSTTASPIDHSITTPTTAPPGTIGLGRFRSMTSATPATPSSALTLAQRQTMSVAIVTRHQCSGRAAKGRVLDELCATTGRHPRRHLPRVESRSHPARDPRTDRAAPDHYHRQEGTRPRTIHHGPATRASGHEHRARAGGATVAAAAGPRHDGKSKAHSDSDLQQPRW